MRRGKPEDADEDDASSASWQGSLFARSGRRDRSARLAKSGGPHVTSRHTALLIDVCSRRGLGETDRGIYLPHVQLFSTVSFGSVVGDSRIIQ